MMKTTTTKERMNTTITEMRLACEWSLRCLEDEYVNPAVRTDEDAAADCIAELRRVLGRD